MKTLIAQCAFPYDGKALKRGDKFEASDEDARMLKGFGKARDYATPRKNAGEPTAAEQPQSEQARARRSNRYQRSDLRARD